MAISKKGKQEAKNEEKQALDLNIKVIRAKDFTKDNMDCNIAFDMTVNDVTIYGCWYREGTDKKGKDYQMVAFPSRKDEKSGKYYNWAYVSLSKEQVEDIAKQIEDLI